MNTRTLLLSFVLIAFSFRAPEYRKVAVIPVQSSFITSDDLGNCYIVRSNMLEKYSDTGTLMKTYSNKNFGDITHVDVSNPMKPMIFYKDFAQVVLLDNTLSLNGEPIRLEERGFQDVQLVSQSRDNGLWLYTAQNAELIRLSEQLVVTHRTGNLRQLLGINITPAFLMENNNRIFLGTAEGVLVFDAFGTYYKTVPLAQLQSFQVQEDVLVYSRDGKLHSYDIKTLDVQTFPLPDSTALSVRIEKQRMYARTAKSVDIYNAQ